MFHASRWAESFLASSGEYAEEAFACLKAFVPTIKSIQGIFFGNSAAGKLEKFLRECAGSTELRVAETSAAVEYAIRFICLVVEKRCLKNIDLILLKIESMLNKKNGILDFTVESASPLESGFSQEFAQMIKEKTRAAGLKINGVNIKTCVRPELLGGYFLRADGFYIDAILKGQVDKMMTELVRGGGNGKL